MEVLSTIPTMNQRPANSGTDIDNDTSTKANSQPTEDQIPGVFKNPTKEEKKKFDLKKYNSVKSVEMKDDLDVDIPEQ